MHGMCQERTIQIGARPTLSGGVPAHGESQSPDSSGGQKLRLRNGSVAAGASATGRLPCAA
jgi:hypothetical protein